MDPLKTGPLQFPSSASERRMYENRANGCCMEARMILYDPVACPLLTTAPCRGFTGDCGGALYVRSISALCPLYDRSVVALRPHLRTYGPVSDLCPLRVRSCHGFAGDCGGACAHSATQRLLQ